MKRLRIRQRERGISTVLATLMMIVIAVAGSLVTYAWVMGYLSFTTSKAGNALQIQSVSYEAGSTQLTVYVQNVGQGSANIGKTTADVSAVYVNSLQPQSVTIPANPLVASATDRIVITLGAALPSGLNTVKVVATDGSFIQNTFTV